MQIVLLPLQGVAVGLATQGVALGYVLAAPSGRWHQREVTHTKRHIARLMLGDISPRTEHGASRIKDKTIND